MSLLLIRSTMKFYNSHQLNALRRTAIRTFSLTQFNYQKLKSNDATSSIVTSNNNERTDVSTDVRPIGERIKENTKTASYFGVIVCGVAVTGIMFFAIFRELLSSNSPNNIYSEALKTCSNVSSHSKKIIQFKYHLELSVNLIIGHAYTGCTWYTNKGLW